MAKIFDNGMISAPDGTSGDAYFEIKKIVGTVSEYCSAYEKAAPLKAEGLSGNYRCLAEFNGTVLAAKYNEEYGFEFVTWDRTYDGKAICQGKYFENYAAAKENFAVRSGLVDKDTVTIDCDAPDELKIPQEFLDEAGIPEDAVLEVCAYDGCVLVQEAYDD